MTSMEKVSVLFFPDNLVAQVEPGSSLLRAASLAGIELKSTCGGKGTCGRCVVKIKDGQIRVRGAGNLSAKMRQAGYVLACMCEVEGNVVVEIPKDSRLDEHQVFWTGKMSFWNKTCRDPWMPMPLSLFAARYRSACQSQP
jgi:uncharacterized 2Fe-2S/4Fe-4S cluster protein (DUF4445 family)